MPRINVGTDSVQLVLGQMGDDVDSSSSSSSELFHSRELIFEPNSSNNNNNYSSGSFMLEVQQEPEQELEYLNGTPVFLQGTAGTSPGGGDGNETTWQLPIYMQFNEGHMIAIIVYSILMLISAVGNITVLVTIIRFRMKARLNRVNLFLLHLAIADLLVTFLLMPLEIGWASTVSWRAGDAACRVMSFFRIFGLYLSGFLLVCISLDRYFAVLKPLAVPEANRRGRYMLYAAWGGSTLCSLPQAVIFHVERHPKAQWFEQCVTFNFFSTPGTELAYSVFGFIFLYGFPLAMIICCYSCILYEIFKINNLNRVGEELRRSSMGALGRAKIRTLKMTVMIVATFFLCWTPYNIMSLWYWIDRDSALQVDQRVQKGLFLFACTNSCVNPMVYGLFHIRKKKPADINTARVSNNCRHHRVDKAPYKVRVRWRPRAECLCAATSSATSQMNSTSGPGVRIGLRPLYEVNGRHVYLNGHTPASPHLSNNGGAGRSTTTQSTRLNNNTRPAEGVLKKTQTRGGGRAGGKNGPGKKSRRVKFVNLQNYNYADHLILSRINFSNHNNKESSSHHTNNGHIPKSPSYAGPSSSNSSGGSAGSCPESGGDKFIPSCIALAPAGETGSSPEFYSGNGLFPPKYFPGSNDQELHYKSALDLHEVNL